MSEKEYKRAWYEKNREAISIKAKAYYLEHREEKLAYAKKRREANPEKIKAEKKAYQAAHPEKKRDWEKKQLQLYPDKTRERRRRNSVKCTYGLSPSEYAAMQARQGGLCAICGKPPKGNKVLGVDHNHKTGRVRELLCTACNIKVGHYESPLLDKVRAYVAKHNQLDRRSQRRRLRLARLNRRNRRHDSKSYR